MQALQAKPKRAYEFLHSRVYWCSSNKSPSSFLFLLPLQLQQVALQLTTAAGAVLHYVRPTRLPQSPLMMLNVHMLFAPRVAPPGPHRPSLPVSSAVTGDAFLQLLRQQQLALARMGLVLVLLLVWLRTAAR